MRLPVVPNVSTKDGVSNKNARLTNCLKESKQSKDAYVWVRGQKQPAPPIDKAVIRPGLVLDVAGSGVGNGLVSFNGDLISVYGSTLGILDSGAALPSWSAQVLPNSGTWSAIGGGAGIFVAVGGGQCATSGDGVTWATGTMPAGDWCSPVWNGSVFCTVPYGVPSNVSLTSPDGLNWTSHATLPTSDLWQAVSWNGTIFCAVCFDTDVVATSTDGATWSAHSLPGGATALDIASNGTAFCVTSSSGATVSTDGSSWSAPVFLPATGTYVTWNGSVFASVASGGYVDTSPDGISWSAATATGAVGSPVFVSGGNDTLVVIGVDTVYAAWVSLDDGVSWTRTALAVPTSFYVDVANNGSRFFVNSETGTVGALGVASASYTILPLGTVASGLFDFAQSVN